MKPHSASSRTENPHKTRTHGLNLGWQKPAKFSSLKGIPIKAKSRSLAAHPLVTGTRRVSALKGVPPMQFDYNL